MIYKNTLNLLQVRGGNYIKQTDRASLVGYQLRDHKHKKICDLDGKDAYITLTDRINERFYKTQSIVDGSIVMFTLDGTLPSGIYDVEIEIEGHVFPSDDRVWLNISISNTYNKYVGSTGFDITKYLTKERAEKDYAKVDHKHLVVDITDFARIEDDDINKLFE